MWGKVGVDKSGLAAHGFVASAITKYSKPVIIFSSFLGNSAAHNKFVVSIWGSVFYNFEK